MARQGFPDQADGAGVDGSAIPADGVAQPAVAAQARDQRAADRIDVASMRIDQVVRRPGVEFARQRAMPLFKERPVQVVHQFPSKRGRSLATKAW